MPRATNNDVLAAIAKLMECRDHRRGRKPSWNILIHTDDNGTVHIKDLITNCSQIVGKRAYKKRAFTTPTKPATPSVMRTGKKNKVLVNVVTDDRISPRTGKPVRKYKPRAPKFTVVENEPTNATIKPGKPLAPSADYKNALTSTIAELKVTIAQAMLSREVHNGNGAIKLAAVCDKVIENSEKLLAENKKKLEALG